MQTLFKIFIVIVSLFVPVFLIILAIFVQFFMFGEGSGSGDAYAKYENIYLVVYIVLALLHGWLLLNLFKDKPVALKAAVIIAVAIAYIFMPYLINI
jgi:flagellar basal body-associated protein FliL